MKGDLARRIIERFDTEKLGQAYGVAVAKDGEVTDVGGREEPGPAPEPDEGGDGDSTWKIIEYIKEHPELDDDDFHEFAEGEGLDPHQAEEMVYAWVHSIAGKGLAMEKGYTVADAPEDQLKMGTEVEMEHTDDPKIAERIVLDHLAEFPGYYTALKQMEDELRQQEQGAQGG